MLVVVVILGVCFSSGYLVCLESRTPGGGQFVFDSLHFSVAEVFFVFTVKYIGREAIKKS